MTATSKEIEALQKRILPPGIFPHNAESLRPMLIPESISKRTDTKRDPKDKSTPKGRDTRKYFNTVKEVGMYVKTHNELNANIPTRQYRWYESHLSDEEVSEILLRITHDKAVVSIPDLYGKLTYTRAHTLHGQRIELLVHELALHPWFDPLTQTQRLFGVRKILITKMQSKRRSEMKKAKKAADSVQKPESDLSFVPQTESPEKQTSGKSFEISETNDAPIAIPQRSVDLDENVPQNMRQYSSQTILEQQAVSVVPDLPLSVRTEQSIDKVEKTKKPLKANLLTQPDLPLRNKSHKEEASVNRTQEWSGNKVKKGKDASTGDVALKKTTKPSAAIMKKRTAVLEPTNLGKSVFSSGAIGSSSDSVEVTPQPVELKRKKERKNPVKPKAIANSRKTSKGNGTEKETLHLSSGTNAEKDFQNNSESESSLESDAIEKEIARLQKIQRARRTNKKARSTSQKRAGLKAERAEKRLRIGREFRKMHSEAPMEGSESPSE